MTPLQEKPYGERLLAWIDLLGFEDWIKATGSNPKDKDKDIKEKISMVAALKNLFDELLQMHARYPDFDEHEANDPATQADFRYTQFSDTIALSTRNKGDLGVGWICDATLTIVDRLVKAKMPFRGAIVCGELFHDNEQIFGPAVLEAHHLEKKCAVYPRILVSGTMVKRMEKMLVIGTSEKSYKDKYLAIDSDYNYYLDYIHKNFLNAANYDSSDFLQQYSKGILENIYTLAQKGLNHENPAVRMKYTWLANKYDKSVMILLRFATSKTHGIEYPWHNEEFEGWLDNLPLCFPEENDKLPLSERNSES